jgi:hypothetical protein
MDFFKQLIWQKKLPFQANPSIAPMILLLKS